MRRDLRPRSVLSALAQTKICALPTHHCTHRHFVLYTKNCCLVVNAVVRQFVYAFGAQISLNCFHFISFVTLTFCRLSPFLCFYPAVLTSADNALARLWSTNAPHVHHIPHALRSTPLGNVYNHLARANDQPTSFIVAHFFHFSCAFLILRRHTQAALSSIFFYVHPTQSACCGVLSETHLPITLALSLLRPIYVSMSFAHSVRMPITTGRLFLLYPFASSFFSSGAG